MNLESLANELLLTLFEYLDVINLFRGFHYLNQRFDQLIFNNFHKYHLDFRSISKDDFDSFCQQYFSSINNRIISFRLSDDIQTPNLPEIFFSNGHHINQFIHLKSLSIDHIYSFDLINQITTQCRELSSLTHLSITISSNQDPENYFNDFSNNIWSLPKLTHCYLDISYLYPHELMKMSVVSQSITYLSAKSLSYDIDSLSHLFKHTPSLQRLYIGRLGDFNNQSIKPIFQSLNSLGMIIESSMTIATNVFLKLPNLCYLTLEIRNNYLNGNEWENILTKYFKTIKIFRFKMSVEFSPLDNLDEQVDQVLDSFRSDFWLRKHQWFVRCDWNPMNFNKTGLLYTLPYASDTFHYIDDRQSKSTSPKEFDYSIYNRVQTLQNTNRTKKDLTINQISSPMQFLNIHHLTVQLPCNNEFLSVIPTLDRLISLDVTLNHDLGYYQLQLLLDRAPCLHSLSFGHMNNKFSFNSFNINSTSIRQLELFQNVGYYVRYFNTIECVALARSSLASQCRILLIDVENRVAILELIQTMPQLQILSIRCRDEEFSPYTLSKTNDDLIKWLEEHSSFTYTPSIKQNFNSHYGLTLRIHKIL